jgi:hypothetical protein
MVMLERYYLKPYRKYITLNITRIARRSKKKDLYCTYFGSYLNGID